MKQHEHEGESFNQLHEDAAKIGVSVVEALLKGAPRTEVIIPFLGKKFIARLEPLVHEKEHRMPELWNIISGLDDGLCKIGSLNKALGALLGHADGRDAERDMVELIEEYVEGMTETLTELRAECRKLNEQAEAAAPHPGPQAPLPQ